MYKLMVLIFTLFMFLSCNFKTQTISISERPGHSRKNSMPKVKVHYTCSMHPHVKENKPGKCPICQMNLTKVVVEHESLEKQIKEKKEEAAIYQCRKTPNVTSDKPGPCPLDGTPMVKKLISPPPQETIAKVILRKSQLTHFQPSIFSATTMRMSKKLKVLGRVRSAEEKASSIAARFPARVEKVFVESVGSQIKKGDPVVQVYSPELLTAGEELILSANQSTKNEFSQLYKKAREKLILWGIRSSQINRWIKNGKVPRKVTLYASSSGIVRKRIAMPGKYFKEGQNYFELSDLSQVWIEMDVYEHDSNLVNLNQVVSLYFIAIPGKQKIGKIDFVSPTIDEKTRTLKVRTTISNDDGSLKPGMVAQGFITVPFEGTPVVVPTSAIIDTGTRKIVWIRDGFNKYNAKLVTTGFQSDGYSEIIRGIKEGDEVVLEGNFLLDAQAQFFGGYEDFDSGQPEEKPHH